MEYTKFLVSNMDVPTADVIIGSVTTEEKREPQQGQVMKLTVGKLVEPQPQEAALNTTTPLFGTHIREGIAIVKDWMKKP
jgi:hypothetical protein